MSNVAICHISVALNINFNSMKDLKDTKIAKIENSKESSSSAEVNFVFSQNPPQNILRPVYKIK